MLIGIKNFLFIINKGQKENFLKSIGSSNDLGINIQFKEQKNPTDYPKPLYLVKNSLEKIRF